MKIEWTRVTWYSQIIALILFIGIFALGIWLGMKIKIARTVPAPVAAAQQVTPAASSLIPANIVATYVCDSGVEIKETYSPNLVSIVSNNTASSSSYVNCKQIAAPTGL